jgi:hypothetical protein
LASRTRAVSLKPALTGSGPVVAANTRQRSSRGVLVRGVGHADPLIGAQDFTTAGSVLICTGARSVRPATSGRNRRVTVAANLIAARGATVDNADVIDLGEARWTVDDLPRPSPREWRRVITLAVVAALSLTLGASGPLVDRGPLWTAPGRVFYALGARTVYTWTQDGTLEAREPRTGQVRWSVARLGRIDESWETGRGTVVVDSTIPGGPMGGTITLLDADTGRQVAAVTGQLATVVDHGRVLVVLEPAGVCSDWWCTDVAAFSTRDLESLWRLPYERDSAWSWGVGDAVVASIRSNGEVRSYDLITGAVTTTFRVDWQGVDAVSAANERNLFLSPTGGVVWMRATAAGTEVSSSSARPEGDWVFAIPAPRDQVAALDCEPWICVISPGTRTVLDPYDGRTVASSSSWILPLGRLPFLAESEFDPTSGTTTSVTLIDPVTGAVKTVLHGDVSEIPNSPGPEQLVTVHPPGALVADIVAVASDGTTRVVGTIDASLGCQATSEILVCAPTSRDGKPPPSVITAWPLPH